MDVRTKYGPPHTHSTCRGRAGCSHEKGELLLFIMRVGGVPTYQIQWVCPMPALLYHNSNLTVHILDMATCLPHSVESASTPLLGACPPVRSVLRPVCFARALKEGEEGPVGSHHLSSVPCLLALQLSSCFFSSEACSPAMQQWHRNMTLSPHNVHGDLTLEVFKEQNKKKLS